MGGVVGGGVPRPPFNSLTSDTEWPFLQRTGTKHTTLPPPDTKHKARAPPGSATRPRSPRAWTPGQLGVLVEGTENPIWIDREQRAARQIGPMLFSGPLTAMLCNLPLDARLVARCFSVCRILRESLG